MPSKVDALADVRRAVALGDWATAMTCLADLPADGPDPERMELHAAAAYGSGDLEATVTVWEDLHALHAARGNAIEAARAAAFVALYLMMDTGLMAPVRAWVGRADRLLVEQPESPVHAMTAMLRGYERFMSGDMPEASRLAAVAVDVGDRFGVIPARTLGRVCGARVKIFAGDVTDGVEVLDEVALMLMSGEVDPLTAGMVYCELICAMQGLGEYDRADEWTRVMDGWRRRGDFFGGINGRCRVHRAEMLRLRGDCAQAEDEVLHACEELRPWLRREFGWPLTELGMIRLRRGDLDGAEEAFQAAQVNGWDPQPGLALLHLARGDVAAARALVLDALERPVRIPWKERPPVGGLTRVPLLEAAVPILVAAGELDAADRLAAELASLAGVYSGQTMQATAASAQATVALARGEHRRAVDLARDAVDIWCAIGIPYEAATARLVLGKALRAAGNLDLASIQEQAAAQSFHEMGAVPCAAPLTTEVTTAPSRPADAPVTTVFRCQGDTRTLTFDGQTVLVRDLKGLRYLERLLAEPGREFHVLDLVAVEAGTLPTAGPAADHGELRVAADDLGPAIDDEARRAYRRRLQDIEEDIEEAEAMGNQERVSLARLDRDFIVTELSRAFGLGGRQRPTGSSTERARTSVTRSVRYALARIGEQHQSLADHLERTVATGAYCSYAPDPRVPITWVT